MRRPTTTPLPWAPGPCLIAIASIALLLASCDDTGSDDPPTDTTTTAADMGDLSADIASPADTAGRDADEPDALNDGRDPDDADSGDPTDADGGDAPADLATDMGAMDACDRGVLAPGWNRCPTDLPSARQEVSVVRWRDEIVVVGGIDGSLQSLDEVIAFQPASGTWRSLAPMPARGHHAHAVIHDDRLFVVGFLNANFSANGRVFEYDDGDATWLERTEMPRPRGGGVALSFDGQIVVVGGLVDGDAVATVDAWNPDTDTWTEGPALPTVRDHFGAGVVNDVLVVAGGRASSLDSNTARVDRLESLDGAWIQSADMPTARGGVAAAVLDGQLLVIGGEGNADDPLGVFDEVEAYELGGDSWRTLSPLPEAIHGTAAATLDGVVYLPGGATQQLFGAIGFHQVYVPN